MLEKDARSILLRRIADGFYRLGDRLPSVRTLAAEIGINRNTASKAYQELQREGVVQASRGRGTFVSALPAKDRTSTEDRVQQLLRSVLAYAALTGIPRRKLKELAEREFRALSNRKVRVAFVECNPYEARGIAQRMQKTLSHPVDALVLDELPPPRKLLRAYEIIATTLYHLGEVQDKVGRHNTRVIGLHHRASTESVLQIARLEQGTRLGVIATNERTLKHLLKLVEMYHTVVGSCLASETTQVAELVRGADVLIVHPLAKRYVPAHPTARIITVNFQIEPQSLDYLRQRISSLNTRERGGRSAQTVLQ